MLSDSKFRYKAYVLKKCYKTDRKSATKNVFNAQNIQYEKTIKVGLWILAYFINEDSNIKTDFHICFRKTDFDY